MREDERSLTRSLRDDGGGGSAGGGESGWRLLGAGTRKDPRGRKRTETSTTAQLGMAVGLSRMGSPKSSLTLSLGAPAKTYHKGGWGDSGSHRGSRKPRGAGEGVWITHGRHTSG